LSLDPHFKDPAQRELELLKSSPMIDRGLLLDMKYYGQGPDIGAHEFLPEYSHHGDTSIVQIPRIEAFVEVGTCSPWSDKKLPILLTTSEIVIKIPELFIQLNNGTEIRIPLTGTVPGKEFTGTFKVDNTIDEGLAVFKLVKECLIAADGKTGDEITQGDKITIDKTPPSSPNHITVD
jgi:hypothetical protein